MGIYQKLKDLRETIKEGRKNKMAKLELYRKEKKLKNKLHKF